MKRRTRTITFQPDEDVNSLLNKAQKRVQRGMRTKLINEALRHHFRNLRGKRELPA